MKKPLNQFAFLLLLTAMAAAHSLLTAQITLDNRTKTALRLYVDGGYACTAIGGLSCTAAINPGTHLLEAKDGNNNTVTSQDDFVIKDGSSEIWTVRGD